MTALDLETRIDNALRVGDRLDARAARPSRARSSVFVDLVGEVWCAIPSYRDAVKAKSVLRLVHHLVLEAFGIGRPPGMETRHLDGDYTNNRFENLKWGTRLENEADKIRHGTSQHGERNHQCKLTSAEVEQIRNSNELGRILAARYGASESQISRIRNRHRRSTG